MKEYNWEDLTTDQIAELFREKTWQERDGIHIHRDSKQSK